jgi:hypothetical protein
MKGRSHGCKPEMDRELTEISHKIYSENMHQISVSQFWDGHKPFPETPPKRIPVLEKVQIVCLLHN